MEEKIKIALSDIGVSFLFKDCMADKILTIKDCRRSLEGLRFMLYPSSTGLNGGLGEFNAFKNLVSKTMLENFPEMIPFHFNQFALKYFPFLRYVQAVPVGLRLVEENLDLKHCAMLRTEVILYPNEFCAKNAFYDVDVYNPHHSPYIFD